MSGHDYPQAPLLSFKMLIVWIWGNELVLSPRRVGRSTRRHSYRAWLALGMGCWTSQQMLMSARVQCVFDSTLTTRERPSK